MSTNRYITQIGEPYDYLSLIDKMPIPDIIDLVDADIAETKEQWIHPPINITYQAMGEAGNWKINQLKSARSSLEAVMKAREAVAEKQAEIKQKTPEPQKDPITILLDLNNQTKTRDVIDYRQPLLISIGIFSVLMLLLIWRIKK